MWLPISGVIGAFGYLHFLVSCSSNMNETFHDEYSNEPFMSYCLFFFNPQPAER